MRNLFRPKPVNTLTDLPIKNEISNLNYIRLKFISLFSLVYFSINFLINYHSHFISKTDTSSFSLYSIPYSIAFFVNLIVQLVLKKPNITFSKIIGPYLVFFYVLLMLALSTIISIFDLFYYNHISVFLAYFIFCTCIIILPLTKLFIPVSISVIALFVSLLLKNNGVLSSDFNLSLLIILTVIILRLSHYNYFTIYTSLEQKHLLLIEQKKSQLLTEQLRVAAHTDELTKLGNRHGYYEYVDKLQTKLPLHLTTMILDIDYFKKYNDYYGHHMGDIALKKVAFELQQIYATKGGYSVRWGGEEFLVLLQNHTDEEVQFVYTQFIEKIQQLQIEHAASPISNNLTFSVGCNTQKIYNKDDIEKSLCLADDAQYKIKHSTKNNALFLNDGKISDNKVLF